MKNEDKQHFQETMTDFLDLVSEEEEYKGFTKLLYNGTTEIDNYNKKIDKIIDKDWINFFEDCVISLDNIVRNPRKFIENNEEIVPISLSRSITTESVKHLAQHTNLISEIKEDTVTPNRILNVSKDESFATYENRFIYTLLVKCQMFISKRLEVIKQSNDNDMEKISIESVVMQNYNEYKLNVTIERQDKDTRFHKTHTKRNSEYLKDVSRVVKLDSIISTFLSSSFGKVMRNTAFVRPPITRTNVILKNQDFKKALQLWQFIETYEKIGYNVSIKETKTKLDNDSKDRYRILLFLLFENYKFTNESQSVISNKVSRFSPQFVKEFKENIKNNFDITDIEIKYLFEYAQRQNKVKYDKIRKMNKLIDESFAFERHIEAEKIKVEMQIQKEKEEIERKKILAREKARIAKEKEIARAKAEALAAKEKERLAREKEKERERLRIIKEKEMAKAKAEALKLKEKERLAREKEKERERLRIAKEKEMAKAKAEALKLKEKERLAREKEKERERLRIAKEKEMAKAKAEALKLKEKKRLAREKEKEREKARIAKEKEKVKTK